MKRKLLLFLATLLPIVASAYDAEIDGIYYNFFRQRGNSDLSEISDLLSLLYL